MPISKILGTNYKISKRNSILKHRITVTTPKKKSTLDKFYFLKQSIMSLGGKKDMSS